VVRYGKQRHGPQRYRCNHTDCPRRNTAKVTLCL
jgi:transposase-like protein